MIVAFTGAADFRRPTRDFANYHPEEYREFMRGWVNELKNRKPNDACYALAEYGVPVITMNVDELHQLAGSKNVIAVHGRLPREEELDHCDEMMNTPVLYGDLAPGYFKAFKLLDKLGKNDVLLIVGASNCTGFGIAVRVRAEELGVRIVEIDSTRVREFLEEYFRNSK